MKTTPVKPSYIHARGGKVAVLFLGEAPGPQEAKEGKAFVGPAGQLLRDCINHELQDTRVALDNVVPVWLGRTADGEFVKPTAELLRKYSSHLKQSLKKHQPNIVVCLGKSALEGMDQKGSGILKNNCRVFESNGCLCISGVHPSYVLRKLKDDPDACLIIRDYLRTASLLLSKAPIPVSRIQRVSQLRSWLQKREKALCGFDLETSALHPRDGEILTLSSSDGDSHIWSGVYHREAGRQGDKVLEAVKKWWSSGPRVVHNLKFEARWMRSLGAKDPKVIYDTMILAWLLNEDINTIGLNHQVTHVLRERPYWVDIDHDKLAETDIETVGKYNALDSRASRKLLDVHLEKIDEERLWLHDHVYRPIAQLLVTMEERGMRLDLKKLSSVIRDTKWLIEEHEEKVERYFPDLNIRSTPQMKQLLYEDMGFTPFKWTKNKDPNKREPSTDIEVLEAFGKKSRKIAHIASGKQLKSLMSSQLMPMKKAHRDGYVHTDYRLCWVVTGRLSSADPNLQNIKRGATHRQAFISRFDKGFILQADYSQHELRTIAVEAGETRLLEVFKRGGDPHQETANLVKCGRDEAKALNFGLIYGMQWMLLSQTTGFGEWKSKKFRAAWVKAYGNIERYWEVQIEQARKNGYVVNMFGQRRHVDGRTKHSQNQAVNFPIQSAAVTIVYLAMLELEKRMRKGRMKSVIVHQIHDSIVVDCHPDEVKAVEAMCMGVMMTVKTPVKIPLAVDIKVGRHL